MSFLVAESTHRRRSLPLLALASLALAMPGAAPAGEIPKEGQAAPDFRGEALGGGPVRLADAHAKGPVVLVFLRGFPGYQCPICSAQVAELIGKARDLGERSARVILVYPGPAPDLKAKADEFARGKALPEGFELVIDPDYAITNTYGLRWDAPNETAYPSTFVLDRGGKIRFARVSRTHGGRAKAGEVLEALRDAR